jgi:transposase
MHNISAASTSCLPAVRYARQSCQREEKVLRNPRTHAIRYNAKGAQLYPRHPAAARLRIRQRKATPLLQTYEAWPRAKLETLSSKSDTARAINYSLKQWGALTLRCEDGPLKIDNSIAANGPHRISLGRENFLFAGSNSGSERVANMSAFLCARRVIKRCPRAMVKRSPNRIANWL